MENWFVYIIQCADDTLYTGCTNDLEKRMAAHNNGNGAKYTQGRSPVTLLYSEKSPDRSQAQQREYEIKQLTRQEKLTLISKK